MNTPKHYNFGEFEPINVIRSWNCSFEIGNVLKYIARRKLKGTEIKDLEKAVIYLEKEKERISVDFDCNEKSYNKKFPFWTSFRYAASWSLSTNLSLALEGICQYCLFKGTEKQKPFFNRRLALAISFIRQEIKKLKAQNDV